MHYLKLHNMSQQEDDTVVASVVRSFQERSRAVAQGS